MVMRVLSVAEYPSFIWLLLLLYAADMGLRKDIMGPDLAWLAAEAMIRRDVASLISALRKRLQRSESTCESSTVASHKW